MIHIFMAAYNGEKYIEEQLISILNQTETDWKLHICDDCSTDTTREIISRFVLQYPDRIFSLGNDTNLGACAIFSRLLREMERFFILIKCWVLQRECILQTEENKDCFVNERSDQFLQIMNDKNAFGEFRLRYSWRIYFFVRKIFVKILCFIEKVGNSNAKSSE